VHKTFAAFANIITIGGGTYSKTWCGGLILLHVFDNT